MLLLFLIYYFFSFCNFIFAGPHWKPHVCVWSGLPVERSLWLLFWPYFGYRGDWLSVL